MQTQMRRTHCPPSPCKPSPTLLTASRSQTSLKDGVRRGTGMGISSAAVYAAGVSEDAPGERVTVSGMAREVCDRVNGSLRVSRKGSETRDEGESFSPTARLPIPIT